MTSGTVPRQGIIAYIFAPVQGDDAQDARAWIRHVWSQCRVRLGTTAPLRSPVLSVRLPDDFTATADPALLAGQQSPDAARQVVLQRSHDTFTLSLRLSADDGGGWPRLTELLQQTAGDLTGYRPGSAVLYVTTLTEPSDLPQDPAGRGGVPRVTARPAQGASRQLAVLAVPGAEAELSRLTWPADGGSMAPLPSYLMHTAKIWQERSAFSALPSAAALGQRVDDTVAGLRTFIGSAAAGQAGPGDRPRDTAGGQLARLRQDADRLTGLRDTLAGMRLTVAVSHTNATRALAAAWPGAKAVDPAIGFPGGDGETAVALIDRLTEDIARLEASLGSVRDLIGDSQAAATSAATSDGRPAPAAPVPAGSRPPQAKAVVLCALEVEYAAMRSQLTSLWTWDHPAGTLFEIGRIPDTDREVALAVLGPGNLGAGVVAERAISSFSPAVLLFVGVAGSLKEKVKLGDIVVAGQVDAYHGGRAAQDFRARPQAWGAPHRLEQWARRVDRNGDWRERLPAAERGSPLTVHFRPIASGEVVLDSKESALFTHLNTHYNDAAAIEMEGAGIAQAAHFNDSLPALVIRGISDLADGHKPEADQGGWQHRASQRAAAFATALIASYAPPSISLAPQR